MNDKEINNITDIREELTTVFKKLKAGKMAVKEANELNNCAGKILGTLRVELEYCTLIEEKPKIPFLEKPNE